MPPVRAHYCGGAGGRSPADPSPCCSSAAPINSNTRGSPAAQVSRKATWRRAPCGHILLHLSLTCCPSPELPVDAQQEPYDVRKHFPVQRHKIVLLGPELGSLQKSEQAGVVLFAEAKCSMPQAISAPDKRQVCQYAPKRGVNGCLLWTGLCFYPFVLLLTPGKAQGGWRIGPGEIK